MAARARRTEVDDPAVASTVSSSGRAAAICSGAQNRPIWLRVGACGAGYEQGEERQSGDDPSDGDGAPGHRRRLVSALR